jgi:soluble cytochrome b562
MFRFAAGFLCALALLLTACAKGPKAGEKNTNAVQANRTEPAAIQAPHMQPTVKGDVERAALAISRARDAAKLDKWQEASAQLQAASKEVKTALTRNSRFREDFDELSSALDRTISTLDRHGKEAESQLTELQTRIFAIKVKTSQ